MRDPSRPHPDRAGRRAYALRLDGRRRGDAAVDDAVAERLHALGRSDVRIGRRNLWRARARRRAERHGPRRRDRRRELVDAGGSVVVQDRASSVIWGMPGAVAASGIAERHPAARRDRPADRAAPAAVMHLAAVMLIAASAGRSANSPRCWKRAPASRSTPIAAGGSKPRSSRSMRDTGHDIARRAGRGGRAPIATGRLATAWSMSCSTRKARSSATPRCST